MIMLLKTVSILNDGDDVHVEDSNVEGGDVNELDIYLKIKYLYNYLTK